MMSGGAEPVFIRPLVAHLRVTLAAAAGADGTLQGGDLGRELERLGIASDSAMTPIDAISRNPGSKVLQ